MPPIHLLAHMDRDAEARMQRDGTHVQMLRLRLPAPAGAKPMVAVGVRSFGSTPAAAIACRASTHHLRSGTRVEVSARSITWRRGVARLDGIEQVRATDLPRPLGGAHDN